MIKNCAKEHRVSRGVLRAGLVLTLAASAPLLVAEPAGAQSSRLPGVIDRPIRDYEPAVTRQQAAKVPESERPSDVPLPENPDEVIAQVDTVTFEGNTVMDDDELQAVVAPYTGRQITRGDLARLKFDVRKAYYDRGYVLVQAVTPPQSLDDGVLNVVIVEARIGKVILNNEALSPGFAQHMADRIPAGEVFRETPVESAVSDIASLGDVNAGITLQRGENTGETDVVLDIEEVDEDVQRFSLYNFGSDLTGSTVANLDFEKNNVLGLGETWSAGIRASDEDLRSGYLGLSTPIGVGNVKLELDYLASENEIGDRLAALNSSGESDRFVAALSKVTNNTRRSKNTVRFGYETRRHQSFLADVPETDDSITQLFVEGSTARRYGNQLVFFGSVRLVEGIESGADEIGEVDATRALGDPQAFIARASAYIGWHPTPRNSLSLSLYGQHSDDVLLSSDLFAIGGYGSVRGHEPAQETGESGFQASVQYRYRWGQPEGWAFYTGLFYDYGEVDNELPGQIQDEELKGAGVSLELSSPSDRTRFMLEWAEPVGDYNNTNIEDDYLYARIIQEF